MIFLDTMVLLFFVSDSRRLANELREEIISTPLVMVSAASIWEIAIKGRLGKLQMPGHGKVSEAGLARLVATCRTEGFQIVPINENHVCTAPFLAGAHKDPFDRLIVAQALVRNATLLSSDPLLDSLSPDLHRRWVEPRRKPPARS